MRQQSTSLRPRQAAAFLGISLATLWRWSKEREDFPKFIKLGPTVTVVPADQLQAWRDAQAGKGAK
ncbi:AlpA family phage regulatory protein [Ramlibacter sp. AW1]|uniref:AlpA family phage regulatory protein n=1 Tax=Ramlibacter aurantiacus TaxID=2801330 RepID=A0A936ZHU8_9BURK|nr:AlpA family phage regulatory protein [Ramlibacter aurantiacus]MBL0420508.1 AlpA family phage regulatory protein [Ramlibacter aurantiacus]